MEIVYGSVMFYKEIEARKEHRSAAHLLPDLPLIGWNPSSMDVNEV